MKAKKNRIPLPKILAAQVMFESDRTCCVCRVSGKTVQIHHIDDNPSNNDIRNLAVLCLDDHNLTQIQGGFGRRLDADQVKLYRDDWVRNITRQRALTAVENEIEGDENNLELSTSLAEIYRENKEWVLLALHYSSIGNDELRDKYIDKALKEDPKDSNVVFLRTLQERTDLIPEAVIKRELKNNKDWTQKGYFLKELGRPREALIEYLSGILNSLKNGNNFNAAFYLRAIVEQDLITELYMVAYKEAEKKGELWWQIRVLQDLEWDKELKDLVLEHSKEIEKSDDIHLKQVLAKAKGNDKELSDLIKEEAKHSTAKTEDGNIEHN